MAAQFPVGATVSATEQDSDVAHCASVKEAAQITMKAELINSTWAEYCSDFLLIKHLLTFYPVQIQFQQ